MPGMLFALSSFQVVRFQNGYVGRPDEHGQGGGGAAAGGAAQQPGARR